MRVIEITESKAEKMSELVEDILLAGGELMHCLSKMEDGYYGERGSDSGSRYTGGGVKMRHHDMEYDDDERYDRAMYGERRGRMRRMR